MASARGEAAWSKPGRAGFTVIEAALVLLIIAVVVGALTPGVVRQLQHARVNRAARVMAADLFLSQSLAGRQHVPIILAIDSSARTVTLRDARTGSTLVVRRYGPDSEFRLQTISSTPGTFQVLPTGMASSAVVVTVAAGGYTRTVRMTRGGLIRIP